MANSTMMRAVVVRELVQSVEQLQVTETKEPVPGDNEVSIAVEACGCNFFDILMVQGKYQVKPPLPFIPGAEVAGKVKAVGKSVVHYKPGDRVFASMQQGAFAEVATAHVSSVLPIPNGMSYEEAAGFGMVYGTSYLGIVHRGQVKKGDVVLVHAAAGGVGLAAVQIAKALGATVIGTVGSPAKFDVVKQAGAAHVVDYSSENWAKQVLEITKNKGVDVVYDAVGGSFFDNTLKCIAWKGRYLVVGFAAGGIPSVALNKILLKNISVIGVYYGSHVNKEPKILLQIFSELAKMYTAGAIKPIVYDRLPLEHVAKALNLIGSRKSYGKVVLCPTTKPSKL